MTPAWSRICGRIPGALDLKGARVATHTEIIDAIHAGINRVEATFGQLDDRQLANRVHEGSNGWTAHQVLAHLAGRQATYDLLIDMASKSNGATRGNFDIDSWNQRLIEERSDRSKDELLREFNSVHIRLIDRVSKLRDDQLQLAIVLPNRESKLGDVLLGSGGMHSIQHAEEVERALGISEDE
jgi:hypothetical protein